MVRQITASRSCRSSNGTPSVNTEFRPLAAAWPGFDRSSVTPQSRILVQGRLDDARLIGVYVAAEARLPLRAVAEVRAGPRPGRRPLLGSAGYSLEARTRSRSYPDRIGVYRGA